MPKPSPLHSRTAALCESHSWIEWSGYLSASMYELDHIHEYNAVRTSCGLFDVSPLYKYLIEGPGAAALLDRILTRDVSRCHIGQVMYTAWCDDEGKIIDDGTLARLGQDRFRLTAADPTLYWLQDNATGLRVRLEDASQSLAALAVQGPTARDLLQSLCPADLARLKYFRLVETEIAGMTASLSRTGFTGDLGYEIFIEAGRAGGLWDALMEAGQAYNIRAAGMTALDMLRIEAGLLLIEVDFISAAKTLFRVQKSSPLELGLDWVVKLEKPFFIGRQALLEESRRGPAWKTMGLELDVTALERHYASFGMPLHLPYQSWNEAVPIYADAQGQRPVGKATSGTWSPTLKKYVAIARLRPEFSAIGGQVFMETTVEARRFATPARVVEMPFFDPPRKRSGP